MPSFYQGKDSDQEYWINLDAICFVKPEPDKLIIVMLDGKAVVVDNEDVMPLRQFFMEQTVNWEPECDDKSYNYEDVPTREEVEASNKRTEIEEEWGRPQGSYLDDDALDDDEIPI
jgi:hypothetical protein